MAAALVDRPLCSWRASRGDLQPRTNAPEQEHTTPIYLSPAKSNPFIWTWHGSDTDMCSHFLKNKPVYHRERELRRFGANLKCSVSVGEHVCRAAVQLVRGHMPTRCPTTASFRPEGPQPEGSVDFPIGRDTSSLLRHTNNRVSLHCVCVGFCFPQCVFTM